MMLLVSGLEEFRKERKVYGLLFAIAFLFVFYVSIENIFY
ncbi:DUF3953 domain-containing protein [Bacillus sp. JCM 19041]